MSDTADTAARWPDGSPKSPDALAAEATGHTLGCNCLTCDKARVSISITATRIRCPYSEWTYRQLNVVLLLAVLLGFAFGLAVMW